MFDKGPPVVRNTIAETGLPNGYPICGLLSGEVFIGFTADFQQDPNPRCSGPGGGTTRRLSF